jgi:LPXTG-motif cell wall-anchored protein
MQKGSDSNTPSEVLSIEISTKPFISFVWLGVVIMSIGFLLALIRRNKVNKLEGEAK